MASAALTSPRVTPSGSVVSHFRWASDGSPSRIPRSRLSGVNRQISSRPVGTGWSARSYDGGGFRWDTTGAPSAAPVIASVAGF